MKTSDKYFNALKDLEFSLRSTSPAFSMSEFCRARNLSNTFGAACADAGIIFRKKDSRGRIRYEWAISGEFSKSLGDVVREVLSLRTNGNRPKIDREAVMTKVRTEPGKRRRRGANERQVISGGDRPDFLYNGPAEKSLAGDTKGFDEIVKNVSGLTEAITRHPGHIDGEKVIKRVQSSIFNRLCPTCAETLHQIIDLLKS